MVHSVRRVVPAVVLSGAIASVATACGDDGHREPDRTPVLTAPTISDADAGFVLDFETAQVRDGRIVSVQAPGSGTEVEVLGQDGGAVRAVEDATGGTAAGFPRPAAAAAGNLAALRVEPGAGADPLAPGDRDFAFGLDVLLLADAERTALDDGNNLMQRGLFGNQGQYKLQIDDDRPSCRVAGDRGEVLVKAPEKLELGRWHRLRCERLGDRVQLFVGTFDTSGTVTWQGWSESGVTGDIEPGTPPSTVSIGAKLNPEGGFVEEAPDQYSGLLDRVVFVVGDEPTL